MYTHKNKKTKRGFTLIELLVVISIISLLTSIVLSSLSTSNQKGRDTAKIRAMQEVRSALQLYLTDKGFYPVGVTADMSDALITEKYIASVNNKLIYQSLNSNNSAICTVSPCQSYHLAVSLERTDNKVLTADKDLNTATGDPIKGNFDNCTSGSFSSPDLCYDITP
ncbi:MAG: type II secretion system protein [Candidatus Taylorbacteria bacterium]|nr:type II secretion system protein [Candidatus Taylorbacteria bacterium]